MHTTQRTITHALLALAATATLGGTAQAAPFTIGNLAPTTDFFVQGQSFTPSVLGNAGSGAAPVSGTVFLDSFTINYVNPSAGFANLYIYLALPTLTNAATGIGSLAVGTYLGGGLYDFANTALDVTTKYFAVLPGSTNIFDGGGNLYGGGVDLFSINPGQLNEGFGDFDIGFSASFTSAVPTPGTAALVLVALAGLALSKRQRKQPSGAI